MPPQIKNQNDLIEYLNNLEKRIEILENKTQGVLPNKVEVSVNNKAKKNFFDERQKEYLKSNLFKARFFFAVILPLCLICAGYLYIVSLMNR